MKPDQKLKSIIFQIAAIAILVAAVLHFFNTDIAKWMMITGVAGFAAIIFTSPYPGKGIRGKRLFNIQILAVLLMCVTAYLMFIDLNGWVVTLLISSILTLYCSIAIPAAYKKEKEENKE